MGISFKELITNVGANKVVDPVVAFCWDNSLAEEAALGDRSPHGRKWHVSYHASQWPDPEYPCPREAGYQMMDLQGMNTERWLNQTAEVGKAQPLDAKILTPTGWVEMGDLKVGDALVSSDGSSTNTVTEVHDRGELEVFEVSFSDYTKTRCSGDHLWLVKNSINNWSVKSLFELKDRLFYPSGRRDVFVPMVNPVEFSQSEPLPIDPYLLGALLGDGCLATKGVVSFTSSDSEILQQVAMALPAGITAKHADRYSWRLSADSKSNKPNQLAEILDSMGLMGKKANSKFIPKPYLFSSIDNRIRLLQGLMDTDGFVSPGKPNTEYVTVSEQLAQDMRHLAMSLGATVTLVEKETTHQLAYRLRITFPPEITPFSLSRKKDRHSPLARGINSRRAMVDVRSVGQTPVRCISVSAEDQLYVTDDFIVTHNSIELAQVRKVRDSGRLARSNVPGTSTDPEERDENNNPMPQIGFIDKEHWLTGSVDLPLMVFNQDDKPHIVEVKSKWVEHIYAMQKGERKADTKHIRQLKCSLGMAHKAKNAFLHPTEDRVLDPPDDGSIYYIARDSPWVRGNSEVPTHEFYFKHDEGFMEEGYKNFKIFKQSFLEDVLITEIERKNSRSHPLGWMWSKGACQFCSFKKICKADYEAGITTLSDTTGAEEVRKTRIDYDPKVVRQDVLDFWDSVE